MIEPMNFYIVDVFAEKKYEGNQLAVFRNAGNISGEQMQRLAKEMNYSETTFILSESERDGGFDVRIFTPEDELPFAGHPTLGTAFVIQRELIKEKVETVALNLKVGQIPVTFSYKGDEPDILWMKQKAPVFGKTYNREILSPILGLDRGHFFDSFPIQEVSTGFFALIVPLKTLDAVRKVQINREKYSDFVEKGGALGILIFAPETFHKENHLNVRVFADALGVPEDPATGSANGCLAGYLVKNRYFQTEQIDIRVEQGYEIGRPSLLLLKAKEKEDKIDVSVGGKSVLVAKGRLM